MHDFLFFHESALNLKRLRFLEETLFSVSSCIRLAQTTTVNSVSMARANGGGDVW